MSSQSWKWLWLSALCLVAFSWQAAEAQQVFVIDPWELPTDGRTKYPSFSALVGDRVDFIYGTSGTTHDVYIHVSNTCEMGPTRTRVKGPNSPANYTFTQADGSAIGKKIFFACDVGSHCEKGQNLLVTVFSTEADRQRVEGGNAAPTPSASPAGPPSGGDMPTVGGDSGSNGDDDDDDDDNGGDSSGASRIPVLQVTVALFLLCLTSIVTAL